MCDEEQPLPCITTLYSFLVCTAVFSTPLSRALMPKNTSASFVTQNQSWKKKQKTFFIELPAIWLRNITPWDELLAQLSLRKCVDLSVHSTFAQLSQHLEPEFFAGPPACLPHVVQMPPNFPLPAACRTPENPAWQLKFTSLWFGFLNYVMDGWVWEHWCCEYEANLWGSPHSSWQSCCNTVSITPALSTEGCSSTVRFQIEILHGRTG